jgi:K+-sensing histidine kinase KdpD
MKTTGILLVGYSTIDSKIAAEVARMAFPRAVVKTANTLTEAIAMGPTADTDLLVLPRPNASDVTKALEVLDSGGLPRWAVLVVGPNSVPLGAQSIAPEEWAGPVTSHAFRSAMAQHALRRELVRARGDLNAIGIRIAHDLRTQVASVLATAELSRELLQQVEPAQSELYQPIFDSVDTLGKIIERVSFVTRASSADGTGKMSFQMKEAVAGALERLDGDINEKKASITQPDEWPEVHGTRSSLEKIWLNLISNALMHTGETPRIELGWRKEKNEHRFWIRDHGKGVPVTSRANLFQPFHLLHHTAGPRGLGLPIVHRLSELHGGRCGYEPQFEGGSEFYFTLPA